MKQTLQFLSIILFFILPLFAFADEPSNIYVDNKGNLFIKSKTPLFLRLTTSLDKDAPSFILRNQESRDSKKPATAFRLEGHGPHSIIHPADHRVAQKKKQLHHFRVYDDGRSPKVRISVTKAPTIKKGKTKIFGKPIKLSLKASDKDSGVNATYYSLDDQDFATYGQPLNFEKEAKYKLKSYAVDNVGNKAKIRTNYYVLDLTPPKTTHKVIDRKNKTPETVEQNILSPAAKISLRSTDTMAGVAKIRYRFKGKGGTYSRKPLDMKGLKDGEHTLVYAALDRVENAEQNSDYTFYLDNTPPELKPPALLGDIYEKDLKLYVSGSSTIELGATDNKAGVRRIRYNFDKLKSRIYSEPFRFPQRNGKTTFYYAASDNVINISKKENQTVIVDISTPKVTASFHGKHYVKQNVHYIRKSTGIGLDATDNLSGIKSISYDTKTGSSEAVLNAFDGQPFMILDEGEHVFSFRAIDNVNNRSEDHQLRLFVDEIAPDVFHHFSAQKISEDEEIYPKKIKLYLAATDKQAGVKQMYYKVNKAAEKRYKAPITFSKKGTFTISVRAVDRVANSSQVKISFKVK